MANKWMRKKIPSLRNSALASLELYWIAKKFFPAFNNVFHVYLMYGLQRYEKKFKVRLWDNPHYLFFKMHFKFNNWSWRQKNVSYEAFLVVHPKMDNVDILKDIPKPSWKKNCKFLQSIHQVDIKNVVKCWKDFFCYSNTLETQC